jgi:hypothetical protein
MDAQNESKVNDQDSTAPRLSRNVPEPTSYSGKYYVELPFNQEQYFSPDKTKTPDYALKFGVDSYVEIPHNPALAITDNLTICAWVKVNDLSSYNRILGKTEKHIPAPYDYYLMPTSGRPRLCLGQGESNPVCVDASAGISAGSWQHIAVTLQIFPPNLETLPAEEGTPAEKETSEYYLVTHYINGEAVKDPVKIEYSAVKLTDKGEPLKIGSRGSKDIFMNGQIDQVQIWNRALTEDEIKTYKDSVLGGFEEGLVGCWSMNEGRDTVVHDISQYGLDSKDIKIIEDSEDSQGGVSWVFSDRAITRAPKLAVDEATLQLAFDNLTQRGVAHPIVFPDLGWITTEADRAAVIEMLNKKKDNGEAVLNYADFDKRYQAGERLRIFRNVYSGNLAYDFQREPAKVESRMFLIETYCLSSFLGAYGVGRTVRTFSLLPGEKTSISISTYKKSETSAQQASSIFDSYSQESADDFSNELATEQADTTKSSASFSWQTQASGSASWGWGSARASASAGGSSNKSRESFAKCVSNVTSKHAAKASAKRDVQINTSSEIKTQEGEETAIQRVIENINVSRTLNFVFRQMNQEYITLLHLVDVKVGFGTVGIPQSRRVVPLPELDSLIDEVIVNDPKKREKVKDFIIRELQNIRDYQDKTVKEHQAADKAYPNFVDKVVIKDAKGAESEADSYYRVRKDFTSTYMDPTTGTRITVPGIIISADKIVMRTDDIAVDALLGEGDALDEYSQGLQTQAVSAEQAPNINSGEMQVYTRIFGEVPIQEYHVQPAPQREGHNGKEKDKKAK